LLGPAFKPPLIARRMKTRWPRVEIFMIHARRRAADVSIHVLPLPLSSLDLSLFLSATNAIAGARSAANKLLPSGFILSLPAIAPRFKSPKKGRVSVFGFGSRASGRFSDEGRSLTSKTPPYRFRSGSPISGKWRRASGSRRTKGFVLLAQDVINFRLACIARAHARAGSAWYFSDYSRNDFFGPPSPANGRGGIMAS